MVEKKSPPQKDNVDDTAMSFGRYLKALRVEKGISLKTVAAGTCINVKTLELLEAEDHDHLPDEIFVKGFIRSYAKLIGANPDEIIQQYLVSCHFRRQNVRFQLDLVHSHQRFWQRLFFSLVAIGGLIFASVILLMPQPEENKSPEKEAPQAMPAQNPNEKPPAKILEKFKPNTATVPVPGRVHSLVVTTMKDTWIKIIVDERAPKTYTLNRGDHLELTARKGFNLLIGNAAGVSLKLNDKPVKVSGGDGQMVTLRLP